MNITVVGTGGWGTALAVLLHGNGHRVTLWGRLPEEVEPILATRENKLLLPGVKVPEAITVTLDTTAALTFDCSLLPSRPVLGTRWRTSWRESCPCPIYCQSRSRQNVVAANE